MSTLTWAGVAGYVVGLFLLLWALLLGISGSTSDQGEAMVKALLAIAFFAGSTGSIVIAWYLAWLRSQTRR